ncbi:MAG: antibiotic biosynthesis monooxygenase [Clostridia bacterium]|nr:antibiotic biosynthesis monooxygenase [Clostridia bacterium]
MSITLNIYYCGKDSSARAFAREMLDSGTVAAIRAENGNLRYEYFFPAEDPQTVLLIDSWCDQAALDKHHGSPIMDRIEEMREKYDIHMKVERYIPDEDRPSDGAFIR